MRRRPSAVHHFALIATSFVLVLVLAEIMLLV
jgi:hypothetical protein